MPTQPTDVLHASTTDHRIPKTPSGTPSAFEPTPGKSPLIPFPAATFQYTSDIDAKRDLAIGLLQAEPYHPGRVLPFMLQEMILPLQQAVNRNPGDIAARENLAIIESRVGSIEEARRHFREVLRTHPNREFSLAQLLRLENRMAGADAVALSERLWRLHPTLPSYAVERARALGQAGLWRPCFEFTAVAVEKFPVNIELRQWLAESAAGMGDSEFAETQYRTLLRLFPNHAEAIELWWQSLRR